MSSEYYTLSFKSRFFSLKINKLPTFLKALKRDNV